MAVRINITIPEYVLAAADARAAELGISRSGYIATALQFKMQYDDMMREVPKMMQLLDDVRSGKAQLRLPFRGALARRKAGPPLQWGPLRPPAPINLITGIHFENFTKER